MGEKRNEKNAASGPQVICMFKVLDLIGKRNVVRNKISDNFSRVDIIALLFVDLRSARSQLNQQRSIDDIFWFGDLITFVSRIHKLSVSARSVFDVAVTLSLSNDSF